MRHIPGAFFVKTGGLPDILPGRRSGRGVPRVDFRSSVSVAATEHGAIAQLGERLHGMQEVGGSIPPGSTTFWTRFLDRIYLITTA